MLFRSRPWIAESIDMALAGHGFNEPDMETRLALALDHFRDSLNFYGDRLGLKIFRKHLAAYVNNAPWPTDPESRRLARQSLCRLEDPREVEVGLTRLWHGDVIRLAA